MRAYMKEANDDIREDFDERTKILKDLILELKARFNLQEKETQSKINEIISIQKILSEKVSAIDSKISEHALHSNKSQVSDRNLEKKLDAVLSRLNSQNQTKKLPQLQ